MGAEFVDCPFDSVAVAVVDLVEGRWPSTLTALALAAGVVVVLDCYHGLDLAAGQVGADGTRGVGLVSQHRVGARPWPAGSDPGDCNLGEGEFEGDRVVALSHGGDES